MMTIEVPHRADIPPAGAQGSTMLFKRDDICTYHYPILNVQN